MTDDDTNKRLLEIESEELKLKQERLNIVIHNARLKGIIVNSPDELKCELHPDSKFIAGQRKLEWHTIKIYCCEECDKKHLVSSWNSLKNVAYECPVCGIVFGKMREGKYDDIGFLSGSAGVEFTCIVCHNEMGRIAYVVS